MNFLKLRHQNMKNYNANPRPYGRGCCFIEIKATENC